MLWGFVVPIVGEGGAKTSCLVEKLGGASYGGRSAFPQGMLFTVQPMEKCPMTNKKQISAQLVMILAGYVSDSFSGIQHPLIYQLLIGLAVCLLIIALFT